MTGTDEDHRGKDLSRPDQSWSWRVASSWRPPKFLFLEHMPSDIARRHTVVDGAAKVVDGHIALATTPGLGIKLNLDEISR